MPQMHDRRAKRAVLQALRRNPDFSGIAAMPLPRSRQGRRLLQWLDLSGTALSFLKSVQTLEAGACLPDEWRDALEGRRERNATRFRDMLDEFQRLNQAFRARGVLAITLKGFSLSPDFCEDPALRHQADFDFLVAPSDVDAAASVLQSCGYSTPRLSYTSESCFTTPLSHIPSSGDDLYTIQHDRRQVDLHLSLAESYAWLKPDVPGDFWREVVPMELSGVHFHALPLADRFLVQVLHAFRHSFRSWIRLSWLMELGRCMEIHREDEALWAGVMQRAGDAPLTKRIFAFVLSLANRLFECRIPPRIRNWAAEGMSPSLRIWLDYFSVDWAISDWPGDLSNLFLASDFISDKNLRKQYLVNRLLPGREQMTIETTTSAEKNRSVAWNLRRLQYLAHRATVHIGGLLSLPLDHLRWRRALSVPHPAPFDSDS
jgi:hypothetical protein